MYMTSNVQLSRSGYFCRGGDFCTPFCTFALQHLTSCFHTPFICLPTHKKGTLCSSMIVKHVIFVLLYDVGLASSLDIAFMFGHIVNFWIY